MASKPSCFLDSVQFLWRSISHMLMDIEENRKWIMTVKPLSKSQWYEGSLCACATSLYTGVFFFFLLFLLQGSLILKLWALLSLCACVIYLFPTCCDWGEMEAARAQRTRNCSCSCPIFCSCLKEHCFGEGKAGTAISYTVMSRGCTMQPWNYHLHALVLFRWNFPN